MKWFEIFRTKFKKLFTAWQIELTTRCPLKCRMCIREGCDGWRNADMEFENFKKLIPYFKAVDTVVLEGWGESLLYKDLIDAIRLIKREGSNVGFVTSGKGLDRIYNSELIDAGVDFIGFSFGGATSMTHNSLRINSDFESLLNNIKDFVRVKAEKRLKKPRLHIIYLMLKENISEVPSLINLAKGIGIDEIVLTNLIHITNEWQDRQRVFICEGETQFPLRTPYSIKEILNEAEIKARKLKIKLRQPSLSHEDIAVCEENPLRNLYISVDGEVSPCVYLYPPLPSPFKRIFCSSEFWIDKVSFGNIFKESLHKIWDSMGYRRFRECFIKRKRKFQEMHFYLLEIEGLRKFEIEPLPEPPKECRTCHKILGV